MPEKIIKIKPSEMVLCAGNYIHVPPRVAKMLRKNGHIERFDDPKYPDAKVNILCKK